MIKPVSLSEKLMFSTLIIEAPIDAQKVSHGTGVLFYFPLVDGKECATLITNKHVILNNPNQKIRTLVHTETNGEIDEGGVLLEYSPQWFFHPNPDVDLCLCLVNDLGRICLEKTGKNMYCVPLREDILPNDEKLNELRAMEDVIMVGYPNGLFDTKHNLPLFRRGITSNHPAIDFNDRSIGVVDMCVVKGSSGSPVFILDEKPYVNKQKSLILKERIMLLGINSSVAIREENGDVVIEHDNESFVGTSTTKIPINLGYYIKAKEILQLKNSIVLFNPAVLAKLKEIGTL